MTEKRIELIQGRISELKGSLKPTIADMHIFKTNLFIQSVIDILEVILEHYQKNDKLVGGKHLFQNGTVTNKKEALKNIQQPVLIEYTREMFNLEIENIIDFYLNTKQEKRTLDFEQINTNTRMYLNAFCESVNK